MEPRSTRDIIEILFKLIVKVPVVGSIVVSAVLPTTGALTINLNSISISNGSLFAGYIETSTDNLIKKMLLTLAGQ